MKQIIFKILPIVVTLVTITSCGDSAQKSDGKQQSGNLTESAESEKPSTEVSADAVIQANVGDNISHTDWDPDKATSVTFDKFPATLAEWKEVQKQLGGEPQGAVALQVMAFELYRNNRADGEQALSLNNTSINYNSTVERLREMMGKDKYYARPYIARAMLRGATPENGYETQPPYIIDMKVDPNKEYQESQLLKGTVIYLLIDSKGWDTNWRGVEVIKPEGSDYFVVSNCPAMYTQCKEAKTSN